MLHAPASAPILRIPRSCMQKLCLSEVRVQRLSHARESNEALEAYGGQVRVGVARLAHGVEDWRGGDADQNFLQVRAQIQGLFTDGAVRAAAEVAQGTVLAEEVPAGSLADGAPNRRPAKVALLHEGTGCRLLHRITGGKDVVRVHVAVEKVSSWDGEVKVAMNSSASPCGGTSSVSRNSRFWRETDQATAAERVPWL